MPELYNVTLEWPNQGEGNYTTTVWADSEKEAIRLTAEEMVDASSFKEYMTPEERERWINDAVKGFHDVYKTADQAKQDLELLYAKELDGGRINMTELGSVLAENRERLVRSNA